MAKRPLNPVFSESTAKALIYKCMVCHKPCEGFYGAHASEGGIPQGTCSKTCENEQEKKPKYEGHSEEDFLKKFNLQ